MNRPEARELDAAGTGAGRWRMLALLAAAEFLGMSLWFTASAVAPQLQAAWGLTGQQAAWLTTIVQLGFVAGTACAAVLNLADVFPARRYFAASALLAGIANGLVAIAGGYAPALVCRFFTGFFLAGVYPPAMKMISTWFRSSRGLAIGTIVGALTLGKATPYLTRALEGRNVSIVVLAASAGALLAAGLVWVGYRDGPHPFERRPFSWRLAGTVLRHRPTRLATAGYLGHMWELYAVWTWLPAFLAASAVRRAARATEATAGMGAPDPGAAAATQAGAAALHAGGGWVDLAAFVTIGIGAAGCVLGGVAADRIGRERLASLALGVSGGCALAIGFLFGASPWMLLPVAWIWGLFVVADSAQFSALVTEVTPRHAVGTALTLQTSLGFLLTMATIQLVPALVSAVGWPWAFPVLALGPAFGIGAMMRLARVRRRTIAGP